MKKLLPLLLATTSLFAFVSSAAAKALTVGFAQTGAESAWRTANTESMKNEATKRGITLKLSDGQGKQENQIRAVRSFITQGVDAIVIAPIVETGWEPVLKEAKRAKIPVIILSTYANRLTGFGGNFLKPDGTSALDSTEAVEALKSLLASAPHALPTPLETRFEEGLPAFLNGKAAQIDFWTDLGGYAQDPKGSKIVDKWGVTRIPVGGKNKTPRLAFNAGFGFAITSGSKNKDVAWELIKFATSASYHEELLALTGSGIDPDRYSGLASPKYKTFQPLVQPLLDGGALENSLAWPTAAYAPKLENALTDELALALAGTKSAEQAIQDAHVVEPSSFRSPNVTTCRSVASE